MPQCPRCSSELKRGPDGAVPSACLNCGAKFKVVRRVAPTAAAPSAALDNLFPPAPARPAAAPDLDFAARKPAPDNPFADVAVAAEPRRRAAPPSPFGAPEIRVPAHDAGRGDLMRNAVVVLAVAGLLGAGWYFRGQNRKPDPAGGAVARHARGWWEVLVLPTGFRADEVRARQAGLDLAFHRPDRQAWITVRSEDPRAGPPPLGDAAERAAARWEERLSGFAATGRPTVGKLSDDESRTVVGQGTLDGRPTRIETVCAIRNGVVAELAFEAPAENFARLEGDFKAFKDGFRFTALRPDHVSLDRGREVATFASKKYPYRLQAPARLWKESPDLDTGSRFDDLKLIDRDKAGEIVVAPRETADLEGLRQRFLDTLKRRYEGKVVERPLDPPQLMLRGRRALRLAVSATTLGTEYLLLTTIVQGDHGYCFVVQCRCPADRRDAYEPVFQQVVENFEVLPSEAPKPASVDPPPPPIAKARPPDREPAPEPEFVAEPAKKTVAPAAPPAGAAKQATPEAKQDDGKKSAAKKDGGKSAKDRKALDDLD